MSRSERSAVDESNPKYKPHEKESIEAYLRGADYRDFVKPGKEIHVEYVKWCNQTGYAIASQPMLTRAVSRKFEAHLAYVGNNGGRFELLENCGKSTSATRYVIDEKEECEMDENSAILDILIKMEERLTAQDERLSALEKQSRSSVDKKKDVEKQAFCDWLDTFADEDEWKKFADRLGLTYLKGMFIEHCRVNGIPIPYLENDEKRYGQFITNILKERGVRFENDNAIFDDKAGACLGR